MRSAMNRSLTRAVGPLVPRCAGAVLVALAASAQAQDERPFGEARTDLNGLTASEATSAMTLPRAELPGAEFITFEEWRGMGEIPKSGLFIVGLEGVPPSLPKRLEQRGYTLGDDGRLTDVDGQPVAMFTTGTGYSLAELINGDPELFWPTPPQFPEPIPPEELPQHTGPEQGRIEPGDALGGVLAGLLVSDARAAGPHPFRCAWIGWSAVYRGGSCSGYATSTRGEAYGPDSDRDCSWRSPPTGIDSIEVRAATAGEVHKETCSDCSENATRNTWPVGCFWPANGADAGWSFLDMTDSGRWLRRVWSWSERP